MPDSFAPKRWTMSLFKSSLPAGFLFPYRHPKAKGLVEGTLYGLGSLFRGVGAALDELGSMVQGPQGSVKDHGAFAGQWACWNTLIASLLRSAYCAQSSLTWRLHQCTASRMCPLTRARWCPLHPLLLAR